MATKRVVDHDKLIVDQSMASSFQSDQTNILYTDRIGYQLSWSGTPTGTFSIQISNDNVVWSNKTLSEAVTATGSAGSAFIDVESAAKFIRLTYTATSGAGTLQAHIVCKSISG